jgi:hypothetical protein
VTIGKVLCIIFAQMLTDRENEGLTMTRRQGVISWLTVLTFVLISFSDAKAEPWNGIYPLRSTRADVEKTLGRCGRDDRKDTCLYKLPDKNILFTYKSGNPCTETSGDWNVPDDTVLSINVYLTSGGIIFRKAGFNLDEFEKEEDVELPGLLHYRKPGKGLHLAVSGRFLQSLYFGPSSEDSKIFRCSNGRL